MAPEDQDPEFFPDDYPEQSENEPDAGDTASDGGDQALETQAPMSVIPTNEDGDMVIGGFAFTPTSLVPANPSRPPDFEDWDRVGHYLRYIHTGTQFWLGDWINYGESNYGEKYAQAVEHTGYELKTLQTYAWVSRQVPRSNRNEEVPFGHYANGIAALKPEEQPKWVKRVVEENLTQVALKTELRKARAASGQKPVDLWLVVLCKDQNDFDKLEKKMRAEGREVTSRITPKKKPKAEKKPKAAKPNLVKGAKTGGKVTQKPTGKPAKKTGKKKTAAVPYTNSKDLSEMYPEAHAPSQPQPPEQKQSAASAPTNETPEQRKKRLKKESNARFRAKQKKGGGE